jgi:hypothetical protein
MKRNIKLKLRKVKICNTLNLGIVYRRGEELFRGE